VGREQLWAELALLLSTALTLEQGHIRSDQADQIREFIDHREFGLAHELLESAFDELAFPASAQADEAMSRAAMLMKRQVDIRSP